MQKHHEETIRKMAEEIILKIDDGRLFGEPIDLQNTSHLIVASNMLAYSQKQYVQQSVHPTASGAGGRGLLANLLVSLGKYLIKIGGG